MPLFPGPSPDFWSPNDGQTDMVSGAQLMAQNPGKHFLMGADPRLPKMPEKPTLIDFFMVIGSFQNSKKIRLDTPTRR